MATVQFGNVSADMRLTENSYGISALETFDAFLTSFMPVREEVLVNTPTNVVVREYDASGSFVTVSIAGNFTIGQVNFVSVEAVGVVEAISGSFFVDAFGNISGTATQVRADFAQNGGLITNLTGINVPVLISDGSPDLPSDESLLSGQDTVTAGNGNDYLLGYGGNDSVSGGLGNDTLDGGTGNDILVGGMGDDTYLVDSASDIVTENAGAGTDAVQSSAAAYTLPANVESLVLTGSGNINGTGNALDNVLTGNSGINVLEGGMGNDTYLVQNSEDVVTENAGEGNDTVQSSVSYTLPANVEYLVLTGSANINGTGNSLNNLLFGNLGANVLAGGAGDDAYIIQNAGDTVSENASEGTDTILTEVSYTLPGNVEHLTLTGTANINGTGNSLNNTLAGNSGVNVLTGGAGNDTYVVQTAGDSVVEAADEWADIVTAEVSFTLPANVEHIFLLGLSNLNATGNELQNVIVGNLGTNTLTGGLGDDIYFVQAPNATVVENAGEGRDTVFSFLTYSLPANVEDLYLQGGGELFGTGNALNNVIKGTGAFNILDGGAGADTLMGGAGDDAYFVEDVADAVIEGAGEGTDTVLSAVSWSLAGTPEVEHLTLTGSANLSATGNSLNNTLVGNAGINVLSGGAGNDTYVVQNPGDSIVENANEGADIVTAEASYTLASNVEHIFLLGLSNLNATGNELQNVIVGNLGTNTLTGGLGDDIYFVQAPNATVVEAAGEGRDTIFSFLSLSLPANVEDLYLQGTSPIDATGNSLDNVLLGTSAANVLTGGAGSDVLIGAGGGDSFVFNAASGNDRIADFQDGASGDQDVIDLRGLNTNFASLNFSLGAEGVLMTVAGLPGFSLLFEGYTSTTNFGAEDYLFT